MALLKALMEWCSVTCANYPGVEIKNMSSSFRDGLAFCAIIHKHRPDLIEFHSLSKDNVYLNNKLAFDVAETKLGIPALLNPVDLVSTKEPDCLTVITYISQFYYFFNRKACAVPSRSGSQHATVLNNIKKSNRARSSLKSSKSLTDLETRGEGLLSRTRTPAVCNSCFKPVHLIQRRLSDGKVYHRDCFRCKVCNCTLLFDSSSQGSYSSSFVCTCHITDAKTARVRLSQLVRSPDNQSNCKSQTGFPSFYSLDGLAITSVPRYTQNSASQDRLVLETAQTAEAVWQERSREVKDGENSLQQGDKETTVRGATENQHEGETKEQQAAAQTSDLISACAVTEESVCHERVCPVPAPRRSVDSSVVPVPAPRRTPDSSVVPVPAPRRTPDSSVVPVPAPRTVQRMQRCPAAEITKPQNKSPSASSHINSPKVKTNHPWMGLVHPGPWSQLPLAPPLTPSKLALKSHGSSNRPKILPRNPFEEEEEEVEEIQGEDDERESSVAAVESGSRGHTLKSSRFEEGGSGEAAAQVGVSDVREAAASAQNLRFPRSLSVPVIASKRSETDSVPAGRRDAQSAHEENFSPRKPEMSKSMTFQNLSSARGPAPGYGFPLIRRKVQTDQEVSLEDLQKQKKDLDGRLEEVEQRGVELERNIRDCWNRQEKEQMLSEWITLFHKRHSLLHQDRELVYLMKQQKLEDRQADVEFELRCLLIKPESEWSQEDRGREKQLMDELVAIIEQRNQVISSFDQEIQREKDGDVIGEHASSDKDFQKDGVKEPKSSKGKFKPGKVFKKRNHKTESSK